MKINEATTSHYRSEIIPTRKLKNMVSINENYLREKPTWYQIDNRLQYFKVRNDLRIFAELFFSKFASNIMNLQTLDYRIAYVRTIDRGTPKEKEETKCGLLSDNFQDLNYNHYLVSELMKNDISNFVVYGDYTLENLLKFFKDHLTEDDYKKNELFLIKLFISDGFTLQVDRNPNNIAFQIPKIPNVNYKDRLHTEKIRKIMGAEDSYEFDPESGMYLLKGFEPNVIYDSERILGIDHKNVKSYNEENCWRPLFPYSSDLDFSNYTDEEALEVKNKDFEGMDPNLCSLYFGYQKECQPYFERLAYDDEYKKILEEFKENNSPVYLEPEEYEYVTNILENQRKEFKKILTM